jgi:hypothetical protein
MGFTQRLPSFLKKYFASGAWKTGLFILSKHCIYLLRAWCTENVTGDQ